MSHLVLSQVFDELRERVDDESSYTIERREEECLMYNKIIKDLPSADRDYVCQFLYKFIKRYEHKISNNRSKSVSYKPKTVSGKAGTKTYIYNLEDMPDPLSDMLILCLREYLFVN